MELITTTEALTRALAPMHDADAVAVDTEFIRETTYWPILCLIQVAVRPQEPVLIDPLAEGMDLTPFFDLMQDGNVTKVFHAGRQDVEIIWKLSGAIPHPMFDTQVAAAVLGHGDNVGYDSLVRMITGGEIDKSSRFTDWAKRPLSQKQLDYAAGDVTHLLDVYRTLAKDLEKRKRAQWLDEEMGVLTAIETYDIRPEEAWKKLKMRLKRPQEIAVAITLAEWRETTAQQRNQPRRQVLKDEALFELATQRPKNPNELFGLRSFQKGRVESGDVSAMLSAIERGLAMDRKTLPKPPRQVQKSEADGRITDLLKVLLRKISEDEGVAARILASSDDIEEIARDDEADVPAMKGWRRKLFGERALDLKHGRIGLAVVDGRLSIIAL